MSGQAAVRTKAALPERLTPPSQRLRHTILLAFILLLTASLFFAELIIGQVEIPAAEVLSILLRVDRSAATGTDAIVLDLRLPRALMAALAGAGLAVCGLLLQTLFRNPLAGPWAMGVTAGAQCGAATVVVAAGYIGSSGLFSLAMLGELSIVTGALLGSTLILVALLALMRRISTVNLLIVGVMLQFFATGFVNVILHIASEHLAKVYGSWNEANFGAVTWRELSMIVPIVAVALGAVQLAGKPLNAMLVGESYARTLGLRVRELKRMLLAGVVVVAGLITAYSGPVGFIDLVIPHACRTIFRTSDHRLLLPAVALLGSALALSSDLVVNLPWSDHFLHLNAVLSLIGAPIAVLLVVRDRSKE